MLSLLNSARTLATLVVGGLGGMIRVLFVTSGRYTGKYYEC
ncbi:hypothetical protein HMPREF9015_00041 [Leptotrichia wadei F0279]|uniref:Uncharacterized protein n=1 Tax=Leptotrichia wadei (strain F0279) TaxID=888055 RepID=U2RV39_LEPWF|nr:hypothetical protein HMPREF9015_00041 [Leptotrichia wadei F0279]